MIYNEKLPYLMVMEVQENYLAPVGCQVDGTPFQELTGEQLRDIRSDLL